MLEITSPSSVVSLPALYYGDRHDRILIISDCGENSTNLGQLDIRWGFSSRSFILHQPTARAPVLPRERISKPRLLLTNKGVLSQHISPTIGWWRRRHLHQKPTTQSMHFLHHRSTLHQHRSQWLPTSLKGCRSKSNPVMTYLPWVIFGREIC